MLKWSFHDDLKQYEGFTVQLKPANYEAKWISVSHYSIMKTESTEIVHHELLRHYTQYNFRVIVVNHRGDSFNSLPARVRTPSEIPGDPPNSVQIRLLNATLISLHWRVRDIVHWHLLCSVFSQR